MVFRYLRNFISNFLILSAFGWGWENGGMCRGTRNALIRLWSPSGCRAKRREGRDKGGSALAHSHTVGTHWRTANSEFVRRLWTRTRRRRHTQRERQPKSRGNTIHIDNARLLILRSWASRWWKWPGKSAARIRTRSYTRRRSLSTSRVPPRASASWR